MCAAHVNNFSSNLVECIDFRDLTGATLVTFVCPVPKISQVMMKWRRRASHLGRSILWHYGRLVTQLSRFTLWHNGRRASQLAGKCTLWHNGRRAKQCTLYEDLAHFYKMNALIQQTLIDSRPSANSLNMYALRRFSTLLEDDRIADLRKRWKDERRGNTNHHVS